MSCAWSIFEIYLSPRRVLDAVRRKEREQRAVFILLENGRRHRCRPRLDLNIRLSEHILGRFGLDKFNIMSCSRTWNHRETARVFSDAWHKFLCSSRISGIIRKHICSEHAWKDCDMVLLLHSWWQEERAPIKGGIIKIRHGRSPRYLLHFECKKLCRSEHRLGRRELWGTSTYTGGSKFDDI